MTIEYRKRIVRQDLTDEPEKLFVFGDNIIRKGFVCQAAAMRGEPNAVGIPTKIYPLTTPSAFFKNTDIRIFMRVAGDDFSRLVQFEGVVVWPEDGIGTGLAQLQQRAPLIWNIIEALRKGLG